MNFQLGDIESTYLRFFSFFFGRKRKGMTKITSKSEPHQLEKCRGEIFTEIFSTLPLHQIKV